MPNESSRNLRRVPLQGRDKVSNNYAQKQTLKTELEKGPFTRKGQSKHQLCTKANFKNGT